MTLGWGRRAAKSAPLPPEGGDTLSLRAGLVHRAVIGEPETVSEVTSIPCNGNVREKEGKRREKQERGKEIFTKKR